MIFSKGTVLWCPLASCLITYTRDYLASCLMACFMSSRREVVRISAVLSTTVLMHFKQNSLDFYKIKWFQFFVLRKLLSNTLHSLATRTS